MENSSPNSAPSTAHNEDNQSNNFTQTMYEAYLRDTEALTNRKQAEAEEELLRQKEKRKAALQKSIFISLCIWGGSLLIYTGYTGTDLTLLFKEHLQQIVGVAIILGGIAYLLLPEIFLTPRFRDVDIRRRSSESEKGIHVTPAQAWPFPTAKRSDEVALPREKEESRPFGRDPFRTYFLTITDVLEQKASDAEEKASILLDKGTTYTIGGIIFFVISIVAWQVLSWVHGFKTEFIYGIASCSGLFIFIEFLSAWFLKQYRQYVDTSTYLIKVKAIFDRYMLVYLASNSLSSTDEDDKQKRVLIEMLAKDITWPESYLLKKQDLSFAKEAASSLSGLIKELRNKEENKKKTDD
jgi:hypothetical protein